MVILSMKSRAPELEFELVPLKTKGDKFLDVSLAGFGGKGAFVTEFLWKGEMPGTCSL